MDRTTQLDYDLLVIGTGGAGMAAAIRGSELDAKVAIVEGAEVVGGTCVNIGCIPSKNLIEAAKHYHTARTGFPGITACQPEVAWKEVQRQKRELVEMLRKEKYLDVLGAYAGVTLLRGRAKVLEQNRVQVGENQVTARKLVVATGATPAMPPIPGLQEAGALNSTTAMELEELPNSLVVIGAGTIGLELGQVFARFGVEVTVLEIAPRILPGEDPDVSHALLEGLQEEGMAFRTGVQVTSVSRNEHGYAVAVQNGINSETVEAEQLLVATGRAPNTANLGLETIGVALDERGFIVVDSLMRTSNVDVFAAGDVAGGAQYVYVAALGGAVAAQAALEEISRQEAIPLDLKATPRVTFTDPQVAAVGFTEEEAKAAGLDTRVTSIPAAIIPRALVAHKPHGIIKLVADSKSDKLVGAHVVAPNAGDFIGKAVLAIKYGLTTQKLVATLHPYLTWAEGLKPAGQSFTKDVAKLSCCA